MNFLRIYMEYAVWNTQFQSLRCLGLTLTILQALKVVAFCPPRLYSNMKCPIRIINVCFAVPLLVFSTSDKRGHLRSNQLLSLGSLISSYQINSNHLVNWSFVPVKRAKKYIFQNFVHCLIRLKSRDYVRSIATKAPKHK